MVKRKQLHPQRRNTELNKPNEENRTPHQKKKSKLMQFNRINLSVPTNHSTFLSQVEVEPPFTTDEFERNEADLPLKHYDIILEHEDLIQNLNSSEVVVSFLDQQHISAHLLSLKLTDWQAKWTEPLLHSIIQLTVNHILQLVLVGEYNDQKQHWSYRIEINLDIDHYSIQVQDKLPTMPPVRNKLGCTMQTFMGWVIECSHDYEFPYPKELPLLKQIQTNEQNDSENVKEHGYDPFELYNQTVACTVEGETFTSPSQLLPELRSYQKAAVEWMVKRERQACSSNPRKCYQVHIEFFNRLSEKKILYNPYLASFPNTEDNFELKNLQGGILADEMGLGKTVEVISCILCNSFRTDEHYIDPIQSINFIDGFGSPIESSENDTECICRSNTYYDMKNDKEIDFVQCDGCLKWLHQKCSGFSENVYKESKYLCVYCLESNSISLASKSTLIISPEPIYRQWEEEIKKHTKPKSLSILIYHGVKEIVNSTRGPSEDWKILRPDVLAKYDIIITTYSVLQSDLYHQTEFERSFRYGKKFRAVPTPLLRLNWWRIVLDEAQLVESANVKAAEMARSLSAVNKWCVSGTPFSRGLNDIFGFCTFLQIPLFGEKNWWKYVIKSAYENRFRERLLEFFLQGNIFWRNTKLSVQKQLKLPTQKVLTKWLDFSRIEEEFYLKQERECKSIVELALKETQNCIPGSCSNVPPMILNHFLRLRQACCHPQVGSFGIRTLTLNRPLTMSEVLDELISRTKLECEEEQRKLIAARNGLAGLFNLQGKDLKVVVKCYLESIRIVKDNWNLFRADPLQRLHILHNLLKMLREFFRMGNDFSAGFNFENNSSCSSAQEFDVQKYSCLPDLPSIQNQLDSSACISVERNSQIKKNIYEELLNINDGIQQIRSYYLQQVNFKHEVAFSVAKQHETTLLEKLSLDSCSRDFNISNWFQAENDFWINVLDLLEQQNLHSALLIQLEAKLASRSSSCVQLFSNILGLKFFLAKNIDELLKVRHKIRENLIKLSTKKPSKDMINKSGNCSKCRDNGIGPKCSQCELFEEITEYGRFLNLSRQPQNQSSTTNPKKKPKKLNTDSPAVYIWDILNDLRVSVSKLHTDSVSFTTTMKKKLKVKADLFMEVIDEFRKECKSFIKLCEAQQQMLGSLDELEMSFLTMRLNTCQAGDKNPKKSLIHSKERFFALLQEDIPLKLNEFETERLTASNSLLRKKKQLEYLMRLKIDQRKQKTPHSSNSIPIINDEESNSCAVCWSKFGKESAVLTCGHSFCCECINEIVEKKSFACTSSDSNHIKAILSSSKKRSACIKCPTCRKIVSTNLIAIARDTLPSAVLDQKCPDNVDNSFGTKVESVVKTILSIQKLDQNSKILVFSQWQDMLQLITFALKKNDVSCLMFANSNPKKRRHNMSLFRFSKDCNILCLLYKNGANGINIVEANHVFLIEPLLNTSIEQQAINRIHRIGQTKETFVHRFIINNSIEENILWCRRNDSTIHEASDSSYSSFSVDKKSTESLSMPQLKYLFSDKKKKFAGLFWSGKILLNNKVLSRLDAMKKMEILRSFECKSRLELISNEPTVQLFDRPVNIHVAAQLLNSSALGCEKENELLPAEVIKFHWERITQQSSLLNEQATLKNSN